MSVIVCPYFSNIVLELLILFVSTVHVYLLTL